MKKCMILVLCVCLLLGGCAPTATTEETVAPESVADIPVTETTCPDTSWEAPVEETVTQETVQEEAEADRESAPTGNSGSVNHTVSSGNTGKPVTNTGNTTAGNTTAGNTTAGNTTAGNTTAGNTTAGNTTAGNTTAGNTTAGNTTAGNTTTNTTTTTGGLPAGTPKPSINDVLMFRKSLICIITGKTKKAEIFYLGSGTLSWYISHPRGISVDGKGNLTPKYEGNYTVYVTDGVYTAEAEVFVLDGLYDFDTSLRFDDKEITVEAGQSKTLNAYGILDGFYYRSSNTAVAKISGQNVTAVAPGTAVIHAQNKYYHAAMIVKVTPASADQLQITLNKTKLDLYVGDTYQLQYSYNGKNKVTWEDNLSSVARVDENGLVTVIGAGSTNIYVTDGEISTICQVTATIRPGVLVESLSFYYTDQPLYDGITKRVGDYMTFSVDAKPHTADQNTYVTTSDSSIIRVTRETAGGRSGFRLQYRKAGTCVITISSGDNAVKKSYTIKVKAKYDCDPGKTKLTPEEYAYYATQVAVENGMSNSILPTGYLVSWVADSDLTWEKAKNTGEGMPHHWWSIGYRYYVVTYEGTDEDGRHIFYLRGA